jgi:hypothetical protein
MLFQPRSSNPIAPYASESFSSSKSSRSNFLHRTRFAHVVLAGLLLLFGGVLSSEIVLAQATIEPSKDEHSAQNASSALPFEVSNPRHSKWPELEASRIYTEACDLLARTVRPEHPPQLRPKFRLVLGADTDEFVRDAAVTEIHLKSWNPEKFAQGVVVVALRDLVPRPDLARLARLSVSLAGSTVDITELGRH